MPSEPSADVIARIVQRLAMFTKPICPRFEAPAGHEGALDQCRHCMYRYDTHLLRDAVDVLASSGAPQRTAGQLLQQIEKALDAIDKQSYGVDVRAKHKTENEVIATVVDRSTAMHELLFIRQIARQLAPQRTAEGWRPIATAPVDSDVLAFCPKRTQPCVVARQRDDGLWHDKAWRSYSPTHWQPLPPPPSSVPGITPPQEPKPKK